jgi:sec-independent protein translocase protein TatC
LYRCVQVPVLQLLLGQTGIVSSQQMFSVWKYVVVGLDMYA